MMVYSDSGKLVVCHSKRKDRERSEEDAKRTPFIGESTFFSTVTPYYQDGAITNNAGKVTD